MRRLSNRVGIILPVAVAISLGLTAGYADGPIKPGGKKIQFSDPEAASGPRDVDPLKATLEPSALKQMRDDIFRPLQSIVPENPLDPVLSLPAPRNSAPQQVNKHTLQKMEQRKNWAFMNMDDLSAGSSSEEMMGVNQYGPDGREKPSVNSIDRFYHDLDRNHQLTARQMNEALGAMQSQAIVGTNTFNPLSFAFSGTNSSVMDSISGSARLTSNDENESPFDRSPVPKQSATQIEEQNQRFQQFQQILNPQLANQPQTPSIDVYGYPTSNPARIRTGFSRYETGPTTTTAPVARPTSAVSFGPLADPTLVALHSHVGDDITARALGITNSFVANRPVDPPKAPYQNPFDQFNKNFKPKF